MNNNQCYRGQERVTQVHANNLARRGHELLELAQGWILEIASPSQAWPVTTCRGLRATTKRLPLRHCACEIVQ